MTIATSTVAIVALIVAVLALILAMRRPR